MKSQSHVIAGGHSAGACGWMKSWENENPQYDVALQIHECVESVAFSRQQKDQFIMQVDKYMATNGWQREPSK